MYFKFYHTQIFLQQIQSALYFNFYLYLNSRAERKIRLSYDIQESIRKALLILYLTFKKGRRLKLYAKKSSPFVISVFLNGISIDLFKLLVSCSMVPCLFASLWK